MVKYRTKAPLAFSEQHVSSRTVMYMRYKGSFLLQTVLAKGPHHNHQIFVGWHISWTSHHIYILIPIAQGPNSIHLLTRHCHLVSLTMQKPQLTLGVIEKVHDYVINIVFQLLPEIKILIKAKVHMICNFSEL